MCGKIALSRKTTDCVFRTPFYYGKKRWGGVVYIRCQMPHSRIFCEKKEEVEPQIQLNMDVAIFPWELYLNSD